MLDSHLVFLDSTRPPAGEAIQRLSGKATLVDVGWMVHIRPLEGVRQLAEFGTGSSSSQSAEPELVAAAQAITLDWLSWWPAGVDGVRPGQLVEDPLGISLIGAAQYVAAMHACLAEIGARRVTLAGSERTPGLDWGEGMARDLGLQTEWRPRLSPPRGIRRLAAWLPPTLSPVVHAVVSSSRSLREQPGSKQDGSVRGEFLVVAEFNRADHLQTLERVAAELDEPVSWLLPWNPDACTQVQDWLQARGQRGTHLRRYFRWSSAAREVGHRWSLRRRAEGEIDRLLEKHLAGKRSAWSPFRSVLLQTLWHLSPRALGLRAAAEVLMQERQPRAVLVLSDYNFIGRIVVAAARSAGVPTVQLQHGAAHTEMGSFWGLPVLTDRMAAWDRFSAQWYVAHGVEPEKVCLTGNPRHDSLSEPIPVTERLPRNDGPLVLVITDQLPTAQTDRLLRAVEYSVRKLRCPPQVLIKTHPCEDPVMIRPLLTGWDGLRMSIRREGDSLALVRQADVVVLCRSTVGMEAILAGCPVVLADFENFETFSYHPDTPFLVARTEEEMRRLVRAVIEDGEYVQQYRQRCDDYKRKYWPHCGTGAARQVANLLRTVSEHRAGIAVLGGPGKENVREALASDEQGSTKA